MICRRACITPQIQYIYQPGPGFHVKPTGRFDKPYARETMIMKQYLNVILVTFLCILLFIQKSKA